MTRTLKITFLSLVAVGLVFAQDVQHEKSAEQAYKNIQVFNGLPASQLQIVMTFMAGSLGVRCNYCHTNPFDKDDKPTKQTARRMIQMVFDINRGNFSGRDAVTCYTCHRGQPSLYQFRLWGRTLGRRAGRLVRTPT